MADANGLVYRGHPLRRVDNLIYYGSMADKYIIMMQVLDSEPLKDINLGSMAEAMEFAAIWLERALSGKI